MNNKVAKRLRKWYHKHYTKEKRSPKLWRKLKKMYSDGLIQLKRD